MFRLCAVVPSVVVPSTAGSAGGRARAEQQWEQQAANQADPSMHRVPPVLHLMAS